MSKKLDDLVTKLREAVKEKMPLNTFLRKNTGSEDYSVLFSNPTAAVPIDGVSAAINHACKLAGPKFEKQYSIITDKVEVVGLPVGEKELSELLRRRLDPNYHPARPRRSKKDEPPQLEGPTSNDIVASAMELVQASGHTVTSVLHMSDMYYDSNFAPDSFYECVRAYCNIKRDRLAAREAERDNEWRPNAGGYNKEELESALKIFLKGFKYTSYLDDTASGGTAVAGVEVALTDMIGRYIHFMDHVSSDHEEHVCLVFVRSPTRFKLLVIEASESSLNSTAQKIFKHYNNHPEIV